MFSVTLAMTALPCMEALADAPSLDVRAALASGPANAQAGERDSGGMPDASVMFAAIGGARRRDHETRVAR
jgi:hypothetical protein